MPKIKCRKCHRMSVCVSAFTAVVMWGSSFQAESRAQGPVIRYGSKVPQDVQLIYDRGLQYLAKTQQDDGAWPGSYTSGITGLCLLAFLAEGEDPNFGAHRLNVRRAVRNIIRSQDPSSGYIPNSMYCHGFGMLALAEAYGAVDDSRIWQDDESDSNRSRTIGEALELAVRWP